MIIPSCNQYSKHSFFILSLCNSHISSLRKTSWVAVATLDSAALDHALGTETSEFSAQRAPACFQGCFPIRTPKGNCTQKLEGWEGPRTRLASEEGANTLQICFPSWLKIHSDLEAGVMGATGTAQEHSRGPLGWWEAGVPQSSLDRPSHPRGERAGPGPQTG